MLKANDSLKEAGLASASILSGNYWEVAYAEGKTPQQAVHDHPTYVAGLTKVEPGVKRTPRGYYLQQDNAMRWWTEKVPKIGNDGKPIKLFWDCSDTADNYSIMPVMAEAQAFGANKDWVQKVLAFNKLANETMLRLACKGNGFNARKIGDDWVVTEEGTHGAGRDKDLWTAIVNLIKKSEGIS
jgi:hypothetical protein